MVRLHSRLVAGSPGSNRGLGSACRPLIKTESHEVLRKLHVAVEGTFRGADQCGSIDCRRWIVDQESVSPPRPVAPLRPPLPPTNALAPCRLLHESAHLRQPPGDQPRRTVRCRTSTQSPCCSRCSRILSPIVGIRWCTGELSTRKSSPSMTFANSRSGRTWKETG